LESNGQVMADAKVVIRGDSSGAVKATDDVKKGFEDVPKSSDKASRGIQAVTGALAVAAAGFTAFKKAMDLAVEFGEFERRTLRIGALLRSTNVASGQTREGLIQMADQLARTTLLNETDVADAISQLLTFRSITGETFERTINLAADLSETMGTDVRSATLQLAKALEEPTIGLTALRRSGVSFTEQQKEQIATLVEQNNLFEAQSIILGVVEAQMGGAATEAAQGFAGTMDGLGQSTRELTRALGENASEGLEPVIGALTRAANAARDFVSSQRRVIEATIGTAEAEARANRVEGLTLQQQVLEDLTTQLRNNLTAEANLRQQLEEGNLGFFERGRVVDAINNLEIARIDVQKAITEVTQDQTRFLEANTEATTANSTAVGVNTTQIDNEAKAREIHKAQLREENAQLERGLQLRNALYEAQRGAPEEPTDLIPDADQLDLTPLMTNIDALQMAGLQAQGVFTNLGTIMATSFNKGDAAARRSFKTQKAFALAGTLISTYFSAQKAFESQMKIPDPSAPVRAAIAAGAALASGLARAAAIRAQSFTGGGGGGGMSSGITTGVIGGTDVRPSDTFVGPEGALFTAPPSDTPELVATVDGRDLVFFLTNTQTDLEKVAIG
jgi:hypothetical protein